MRIKDWLKAAIGTLFSLFLGAAIAAGQDFRKEWARTAGMHLGRVESSASKCKDLRVNEMRRSEISKLYRASDVAGTFAAARKAESAAHGRKFTGGHEGCEAMLGLYGSKGLLIRHYLLRAEEADVAEVPGIDRGIDAGMEPRGFLVAKVLMDAGYATAIETVCSDYEMLPVLQELVAMVGHTSQKSGAIMFTMASMASAAQEYKLKEDRPGFCGRILADHGPDSDLPLVRRKW